MNGKGTTDSGSRPGAKVSTPKGTFGKLHMAAKIGASKNVPAGSPTNNRN